MVTGCLCVLLWNELAMKRLAVEAVLLFVMQQVGQMLFELHEFRTQFDAEIALFPERHAKVFHAAARTRGEYENPGGKVNCFFNIVWGAS